MSADSILHEKVKRINTHSISIAEICGIITSLYTVCGQLPSQKTIHFLCDNQYVVKAIRNDCQANSDHIIYFNSIRLLVNYLKKQGYQCHFHWIPSHTPNKFHTQADTLAFEATTSPLSLSNPHEFNILATQIVTGNMPGGGLASP